MKPQSSTTKLDRVVAVWTILGFSLVVASSLIPFTPEPFVWSAYAAIECVVLLVWMQKGGATSSLWNWLPPFWPWGYVVRFRAGRWTLVFILVCGVTIGLISMASAETI
jgi:hypothetical protein